MSDNEFLTKKKRGKYRRPLAERFWERSGRTDASVCWEWTGSRAAKGYGCLWHRDRNMKAHRLSWELTHGPIPPGLDVCHHCDNRICVNPSHLFLGTRQDNMDDMVRKGRHRSGPRMRGSSHANAKLRESDVLSIREALRAGETQESIGRRFGVSRSQVGMIRRGKRWAHLGDAA